MISVIVAAYNCEQYIEKALQSIFSQTLPDKHYEVIAVNDGSTDDTLDILKKYRNKIKLISQPNRGLAAACNRGIEEAKGDYIIRLDADDYLDRGILSSTMKILESKPDHHCVYTDRYEINASDNTKVRVSVGKDNIFNMIGCGILFRREVFDKIGLYRNLLFWWLHFFFRRLRWWDFQKCFLCNIFQFVKKFSTIILDTRITKFILNF